MREERPHGGAGSEVSAGHMHDGTARGFLPLPGESPPIGKKKGTAHRAAGDEELEPPAYAPHVHGRHGAARDGGVQRQLALHAGGARRDEVVERQGAAPRAQRQLRPARGVGLGHAGERPLDDERVASELGGRVG